MRLILVTLLSSLLLTGCSGNGGTAIDITAWLMFWLIFWFLLWGSWGNRNETQGTIKN